MFAFGSLASSHSDLDDSQKIGAKKERQHQQIEFRPQLCSGLNHFAGNFGSSPCLVLMKTRLIVSISRPSTIVNPSFSFTFTQ